LLGGCKFGYGLGGIDVWKLSGVWEGTNLQIDELTCMH
jgi:hypothetical protein